MRKNTTGFTIVELLITIVVIAVLAAISVVAYNGVQNRTHDAAVQRDLRQLAQLVTMYHAEHGTYTINLTQLQTYGAIKISKASYAEYFSGQASYNYLYCRNNDTDRFGLVARSRSGQYFQYRDGAVSQYTGAANTAVAAMCPNIGVTPYQGRIWFYEAGEWKV